ncbi:MAG: class I SAM-dependent methyltransferase [Myxococcota bacterium]
MTHPPQKSQPPLIDRETSQAFQKTSANAILLPKLSQRLHVLLDWVPPDAYVADIGTDHAHLPIHLAHHKKCMRLMACDKNPHPLQAAQQNVAQAGFQEHIELRLGPGLKSLAPGEITLAILAGMGRSTIEQILLADPPQHLGIQTLLLQSNTEEELLRRFVLQQGWQIQEEHLLFERKQFYLSFRVHVSTAPQPPSMLDEEAWLLGSLPQTVPHALLCAYLESKRFALQKKAEFAPQAEHKVPVHRYLELIQHIQASDAQRD